MNEQLNRMEEKIDRLLDSRQEHHGRITKLETQAGFIKWTVSVIGATALAVLTWALRRLA